MDFRHELKHEINMSDMIAIRQRLRAVAKADEHGQNGKYLVRSLYFDSLSDKTLREKIDGVNKREKFRIRYYNGDTGFIRLEKKSKLSGLGNKQSAEITADEVRELLSGHTDWMVCSDRPLIQELYTKMKLEGLRPKTIVDYTREAFTYAPGNVRVTLDYDIRTATGCTEFLDQDCVTIPAGDAPIILEVKWDEFIPSIIRSAVQLDSRRSAAFSKYAQCRIYG